MIGKELKEAFLEMVRYYPEFVQALELSEEEPDDLTMGILMGILLSVSLLGEEKNLLLEKLGKVFDFAPPPNTPVQ